MNIEKITALAREHGTSCTNRHFVGEPAFAFGNEAWAAFCEALVAAQPPAVEARGVIEQCRAALAKELTQWGTHPTVAHIKQAHTKCVEWLMQAAIAQPVQPISNDEIEAAVLAERSACAILCEARYMGDNNREDMEARRCAAMIRARTI